MARALTVLSLFLLAALSGFVLTAPEDSYSDEVQGAPQMVIEPQIHDFKNVVEGELLEHSFEVQNQGSEPLRIEQVKPSCACSVADFDPLIPSKGVGKIKIKIDTKGFDGPERWVVKVFSNDPTWKEAVLDLRADVKHVITLTGSAVLFTGKSRTTMTREIEISTGLGRPLILTPVQFTLSGKVTYSLSEIETEKRYRVTFQNVTGKAENYRGFLKLKTNFAEKPEVLIWIVGRFEN
jgi:hypothetical protein